MKQLLILLISTLIVSCSPKPITKFEFSDKAELRRFKVETTVNKTSSGYLFFFIGGYSSQESTDSKIKFYAKNKLDEYCLFECKLQNVKIKLDSTIVNAYVTFKYSEPLTNGIAGNRSGRDSIDYECLGNDLVYQYYSVKAIIVCNPKDFPENINLNQL